MIYTEHFDKADRSYECRHNDNGDVIHVLHKDGEAIVFPTLWDLACYHFSGDSEIERFYLDEADLNRLYECEYYDYYRVKQFYESETF